MDKDVAINLIKLNKSDSGKKGVINMIYDSFAKEISKLEKDRDYYKLSFKKQVEASR